MNKQQKVFDSYKAGQNIFVTGSGGTGKSYLIKKIYNDALENNKKISVTALTGIAAILLDCNACTIHSWAGVGLGNGSVDNIIKKVAKSKFKSYNWFFTDILIIDEISMMSSELFTLLNKLGQSLLKNDKPFGGIQLIMTGDFFQLPPVNSTLFCFENENFLSSFDTIINLSKIYRQKDPLFKKMLINMRIGLISQKSIEALKSRVLSKEQINDLLKKDNITRLVPTKQKAQQINLEELSKLNETNHNKTFKYSREFKEEKEQLTKTQIKKLNTLTNIEKEEEYNFIKNSTLTEDNIELTKNAFVMSIANIDNENGIVNGSQGIIIDFDNESNPIVKFNNGHIMTVFRHGWKSETIPGLTVKQIPLILAWSVTIHKAQGLTLDKVIVDIGNDIFECGQMYVAISRVKTFDGLYLENFDITKLKINYRVLNFYKKNELIN